ncbi:MAG TPA: ABC transporter substrate-binding protein [Candidatus Binatia bacterium]|jgi:putative ABC transport system substrate-binding protein|nr:ABC transporter substrate-binding protein [Candidatus Binatia bacterium]
MNTKISIFVVVAFFIAFLRLADAQQPGKVPRIGYLSGGSQSGSVSLLDGFRQGLRDHGYIEGKNIIVEYRFAEGKVDRIPSLVAELVQLNVDAIVSSNFSAIRAAKKATKSIPIVMVTTQDPVASGVIDSLARPGGNITGLTRLTYDSNGKRLETLKELVPTISRVGFLMTEDRAGGVDLKDHEAPAHALKIQMQSLVVRGPNPDLEEAFRAAVKGGANALMAGRGPVLNNYKKQIADLAIKNRLPSMTEGSDFVEAGALASFAANDADSSKRAVDYVDKILKGAKPADLPVEKATKFELVINLNTAQQIGLSLPDAVLKRADKVIR